MTKDIRNAKKSPTWSLQESFHCSRVQFIVVGDGSHQQILGESFVNNLFQKFSCVKHTWKMISSSRQKPCSLSW